MNRPKLEDFTKDTYDLDVDVVSGEMGQYIEALEAYCDKLESELKELKVVK